MRTRIAAATLAAGLAAAAPFVAAGPATASPSGVITFYTGTNYTGTIRTIYYTDCATPQTTRLTQVTGSYDNRPPSGCRVQVSANGVPLFTLCLGKHVMPAAYRTAPTVRIATGPTPANCVTP